MVNGYCYDCALLRPRMDFHNEIPHCPDCQGDFVEVLETWQSIHELERFLFVPNRAIGSNDGLETSERAHENGTSAQTQREVSRSGRAGRGLELSFSFVTDGRSAMPLENFLQVLQRAGETSSSPASPELITLIRQKARPARDFYEFFKHVDGASLNNQCTICLGSMVEQELIARLDCTHVFHLSCLISWLEQQHTCPVCRAECSANNV